MSYNIGNSTIKELKTPPCSKFLGAELYRPLIATFLKNHSTPKEVLHPSVIVEEEEEEKQLQC